ncbi:MAG: A/G-specific adenine glycosylase [Ruminococcaceae bacterium]|nr:A/G-specific adenine glycosylase [Oscillospiraceae bacterium]
MKNYLHTGAVRELLLWYQENKRDLPWRRTRDPYRIWISEIMLQQTRVEAVKPYYARFLEVCPNVETLASIPEERLMKLWEGLGYYSRARNLKRAAQTVLEKHGGKMPTTYEELRALSGIGDYTAGAIASIAYGIRVPAIDGNVLRVLARLQGSHEDILNPKVKAKWRDELRELIPPEAGDFTQAMIELGATVCVPNGEAKCHLCPLRGDCVAARDALTDVLPVRAAKKPRRIEKRTVLIIRDGTRTALCKRPSKGLLAGLYELPNVLGHLSAQEIPAYLRTIGFEALHVEALVPSKHIFTHVEWHMIAYAIRITPDFDGQCGMEGMQLIENRDLHQNYAVPSAFSAYTKYLV